MECHRTQVELEKQISAGGHSEAQAERMLAKLQNTNSLAHIEKSVSDGEMDRAEAKALYKTLGIKWPIRRG